MDASPMTSVSERIKLVDKTFGEGNYREAIAALEPLLRKGRKKTPKQEWEVTAALSACYRCLNEPRAALPHARRNLQLAKRVYGKGSKEHTDALSALGAVQMQLKDFTSAKKNFHRGLAILVRLGEEKSSGYGQILLGLAQVDLMQSLWVEALEGFIKAKEVLDDFTDDPNFAVILNDMAICLMKLNRWTEALEYYRESVELDYNTHGDQHPEYATSIFNLAWAYCEIKQIATAIPLFEEALTIRRRVYGDSHPDTICVVNELTKAHKLLRMDRKAIKTNADVRMCNNCMMVDKSFTKHCACTKVNYCSEECQKAHWKEHKLDCSVAPVCPL